MKISKECKCKIMKGIKEYPDNMSAAARHIDMPWTSFVRKSKFLGVYAPNQGQSKSRLKKQKSIPWNNASRAEKHRRILEEQDGRCLCCNLNEWQGKPICLEYDHINGDNKDERKENVRYLCPNCHSQTPTFRNRGYTKISDKKLTQALSINPDINTALKSVGYSTRLKNRNRAKELLK